MPVSAPRKAPRKVSDLWNKGDLMERLQLVMEHEDLFWSLGLVTRSELEVASAMSESSLEYILMREEQPIFTSINLKQDIDAQNHRGKMEAALQAVFKSVAKAEALA